MNIDDQTPLHDWPRGLEHDAAYLFLSAEEISARSGVKFTDDCDDLGDFAGAIVRLDREIVFALVDHEDAPLPGTKVILTTLDRSILDHALDLLGVRSTEVSWIAPTLLVETAEPADSPARMGLSLRHKRVAKKRDGIPFFQKRQLQRRQHRAGKLRRASPLRGRRSG